MTPTPSLPHRPDTDLAELVRMALSGWTPAPLAGLEALIDRMEARR